MDQVAHIEAIKQDIDLLAAMLHTPQPGDNTWMYVFCSACEALLPKLAVVAGIEAEVAEAMARYPEARQS